MKWLINNNKKYKVPYILANVFLIFFDTVGIVIPILTGYLVDIIVSGNNYSYLGLITLLIIFIAVFKSMGAYFSVIKLDTLANKIVSEVKEKCYHNLNNLDYYFYEHNNKGELMTNFTSDFNRIKHHLSYNIKTIGAIFLTFLGSLFYLLRINVVFTLVLLLPGVLVGLTSYSFLKRIKPEYEKLRNLNSEANDFVSDNIAANKVVKTFALEKSEIKKMQKVNKKYIDNDIRVSLMENTFYGKVDFLSYFTSVIFLIGGGYLFINNKITMGELVIFNAYLYNLRAPFIRLSGLINSIERFNIAEKKIKKLIEATPKIILDGKDKLKSLLVPIKFNNVRIVYDEKVVLENLNLEINPYDTIAFIGKTGSGKSSIVNLFLGFNTPESGEVLINGKNYLDYNMENIREKVGYVTQESFLFSDTIYNNIRYGRDITKKEAIKYAKIACCDYIDRLPEGIDTVIGEKGVGLSGGEKQRLSLARALAVKPDILLLDDITSALDIETEEKINESIKNLNYKSTKIIIASKIVSVMNATKIYVLDKGRVIEEGTHTELLKKKGYYYELYMMQRGEF